MPADRRMVLLVGVAMGACLGAGYQVGLQRVTPVTLLSIVGLGVLLLAQLQSLAIRPYHVGARGMTGVKPAGPGTAAPYSLTHKGPSMDHENPIERSPSPRDEVPIAYEAPPRPRHRVLRALGLGLITGAADDDCSAIGTYASAGAKLGPSFLWTAPITFPMMVAVVYLSAKLGQVAGQGLFAVMRDHYPRWLLYATLVGVMIGNTIEAAADLGGMAAALNLFVPLSIPWIVAATAGGLVILQLWGSYTLIRNIFRWLALALLAYIPAALLAKPDVWAVLKGTLLPRLQFTQESLSLLVAVIGTTLSAYLYTWQSNEEVEEQIAMGRYRLSQRRGATDAELRTSWWDIVVGMAFSNVIMYFIMLATASTLFPAGQTDINTAAEAANALQPLAGKAAGLLFALGVVGVGFLAVPIMVSGTAYDLCQTFGWHHSLHARPGEAKAFYAVIVLVTLVAVGLNFLGFNPMKALVWSGVVQGFSTPPLLLLIMLMTNNRTIMGAQVNSRALNVLGWITTGAIFAATGGLVLSWIL